jgi:hypothetical protein
VGQVWAWAAIRCLPQYRGVSKKSFPSAFSEVRFPLFRPYLVAPPNRSPSRGDFLPQISFITEKNDFFVSKLSSLP